MIKLPGLIAAILIVIFLSAYQTAKPRILILGDSISIGYFPYVKDVLIDDATLVHNPGNAQHTGTGLEKLDFWLGEEKWNVIQFNWGLWDLCYRWADSKEQGSRDKVKGKITFTPEEYETQLDSLARMLKATESKLIFITTSYVPEGEAGRFAEDAIVYNDIAKKVMAKYSIQVNDIYESSKRIHALYATAPSNVHYTEEGYKNLSELIIPPLIDLINQK